MSKVKNIEPIVKRVLEENYEARNDDFILIAEVYSLLAETSRYSFNDLMTHHQMFCLPSIESITRARRKVQSIFEELRATEGTRRIRKNEEIEYKEYARCTGGI